MNAASLERDSASGLGEAPVPEKAGAETELLAQMIHDIKNPLSAILCYAEIVAEAKDAEQQEYCDRLQANARAVLDMLDGFAMLAALRNHEIEMVSESFDWVRQAMRVAADLHSVAAFRSQRLACDTVGEKLLHGDRSKLTLAIRSLLLEAMRLASPGETVEVSVRASGPDAVVQVFVAAERQSDAPAPFEARRPALELVARIAALHRGALVFHLEARRAVATLSVPFV
jgi:signal transduction histidine kinase